MSRFAQRSLVLLTLVLVAGAVLQAQTKVEPKGPAAADPRAADRAAIRNMLDGFVKAFEAGDAKALAGYWTPEGEYHHQSGTTLRGREALEKGFTALFARRTDRKAEIRPKALRFLSATTAVDEGTVIVHGGAEAKRARYEALLVRDDAQWRLAMLRETASDEGPSIDELAWLIGQWKSTGDQGAEILTTYAWDEQKKFIHVHFKITEKDRKPLSGKQVLGVDPATGGIRSWTFEAHGGVGEADWHADGDHWELRAEGTLADGRHLSETNVLRRVNDDTFTWQSVDRWLGDVSIPDLAPVKVVRVKAEK